jgi:hypothetical protein
MKSVENRFDNSVVPSTTKEHITNIKTSTADTTSSEAENKFAKKLDALDKVAENTSSSKQRNISLKSKEMLVKTKAVGNDNVPAEDRTYLTVHFVGSLETKSNDSKSKPLYLYFSRFETVGEVMQHIWVAHRGAVKGSVYFKEDPSVKGVKGEDLTVAMGTTDSPQWQAWDRNLPLKDCFAVHEDVAVFAVPIEAVMANQKALLDAKRAREEAQAAEAAATQERIRREREAIRATLPVKQPFALNELAWYHKLPSEEAKELFDYELEAAQPMIKVPNTVYRRLPTFT